MAEKAKKYEEARAKDDREKKYTLEEALDLLGDMPPRKFDETVEVAMRLGVDPRHADQMVRGSVVLPNGLGKTVREIRKIKAEKKADKEKKEKEKPGNSLSDLRKEVEGIPGVREVREIKETADKVKNLTKMLK